MRNGALSGCRTALPCANLEGITLKKSLIAASAVVIATLSAPARAIDVVFDYTYDSAGFFTQDKRVVLDQVARVFSQNLLDTLTAITPSGSTNFAARLFNPQDPFGATLQINNFSIPENEVRIYVGSHAFEGQTLGVGGPGFQNVSGSTAFIDNALSRGEPGALTPVETDFGPWGGSISFGSIINWYFDGDVSTVERFSGFDFYTVAMHETAHVFGFGSTESWFDAVVGDTFTGAVTTAENGGAAVALQSDGTDAHFATSLRGVANGSQQVPLLSPFVPSGQRRYMTDLDWAALDDIGWEVASLQATVPAPIPEPRTWAMMLGGVLLIGMIARRRA
jgi:hypothetical protein